MLHLFVKILSKNKIKTSVPFVNLNEKKQPVSFFHSS